MTQEIVSVGYKAKVLRVDLSTKKLAEEEIDEMTLKLYLGGTGIGAKYLYEEVPPEVPWSDPGNLLILSAGPLNGTVMAGSGSFSIVTKGAMTQGATSTQANGYFGAYLKLCGYSTIVIQGKADSPVYLYIREGSAELRDASHLTGKSTSETERLIKEELHLPRRQLSVFSIGPAGENLVRFACLVGDEGHVAGHNGVGAVAGSKNLKAIVVHRGKTKIALVDEGKFKYLSKQLMDKVKNSRGGGTIYNWGTSLVIEGTYAAGALPVKNYTTNLFPECEQLSGRYTREHFEIKPKPCWFCPMHHCHTMKVTEGQYAGYVGEEPDYEQVAAWGPTIGQTDPGAVVMLANEVDKIGVDTNESGWLIAWVMECFEKGIINRKDTDGLEMTWGNVESVKAMLQKIAKREGIGDLLAEGVMRASRKIGGEAPKIGIYTYKGNTPRGHDHRALWWELFDTCVSNTGTIESSRRFNVKQLGLEPIGDIFSPEAISTVVAKTKGHMAFEDSLVVCRFTTSSDLELLSQLLNAATGWDFTVDRAMDVGERIVNLMKVFNLRNGITSEMDRPSERYGSAPVDGPAAGKHILPAWGEMLRNYYKHMGWDEETGKPLPKTLKKLGLENIISHIW